MEYSIGFNALLNDPAWKGRYIGAGNPNSKILFVGKECAIFFSCRSQYNR